MDALLKKLNYKSGTIVALNAPDEFAPIAEAWKREVPVCGEFQEGAASFLLIFTRSAAEVASDINRDKLWPLLAAMGFGPCRNIAVDEDWSALRFSRIKEGKQA